MNPMFEDTEEERQRAATIDVIKMEICVEECSDEQMVRIGEYISSGVSSWEKFSQKKFY